MSVAIILKFLILLATNLAWSWRGNVYYRERLTEFRLKREERNCTDEAWAQCDPNPDPDWCIVFRSTLRNRCRKSCNLCGNIKTCAFTEYGCCWDMHTPAKGLNGKGCPRNCHNRLGHRKCTLLRLNGACFSDKQRMEQMCRGVCVCENRPAAVAPLCSRTEHGCCWDGFTAADKYSKKCPVCRNYVSSRICRIFREDCFEFEGIKGWQMRRFCPKACGICRMYKKNILEKFAKDLKYELSVIKELGKVYR